MECFGGIEAGGTKFVCGVGTGPDDLETLEFPTTTPTETMGRAIEFLRGRGLTSLGIASFGPIDLRPESTTFGFITSTPKALWRNFDIAGEVRRELDVPIAFDTDVNGAVIGEARWGAARGVSDALYLTVGTGIGGGALVGRKTVHGLLHPEMGHIRIPHDRHADPFGGCCPYHGDCLEGLASGPAIEQRWGQSSRNLPEDHPAWALEARYLALGLVNWVCTLSPERIILGGGVMQSPRVLPLVRRELVSLLNGYISVYQVTSDIDRYVVAPALGGRAGVLGAIAMAQERSALRDRALQKL